MLKLCLTPTRRASEACVRYAPWAEFDECSALACLSHREQQQLERLHNPRRRREWLASRMLAKQWIADVRNTDLAPHEVEILPSHESRRPRIWICGQMELRSLSIAHSARGVLVALANHAETHIGVDLSEQTPLTVSFQRLWFTADEREWLNESSEPFAVNRLWATKEALYKACNRGEGFDPRQINAVPGSYRYREAPVVCGIETFEIDGQIAAIATVVAPIANEEMREPRRTESQGTRPCLAA
jgi:phosphopantetheinyl transferase